MSTVGAMSGTLATIFSLEKSRKWIIRDGRTGISRTGSGASMARGLKKSLGFRIRGWKLSGGIVVRLAGLYPAKCTNDVADDGREVHLDVVPGEAERDPACEHSQPVPAAVAAHGGSRAMGLQAVELDEDPLAGPHEVGLENRAEVEPAVDDRFRETGPA